MVTATRSVDGVVPGSADGGAVPVKRVTSFIRRSNMPADTSARRSSTTASVAEA